MRRRTTNRLGEKSTVRFGKYVSPTGSKPVARSGRTLPRTQGNSPRPAKTSTPRASGNATGLREVKRRSVVNRNSSMFGNGVADGSFGNNGDPRDPNRPTPASGDPNLLRYSSENPELEKNIREDIRAGKHQENPFLNTLNQGFVDYELANASKKDAPFYSQVARAQDSSFGYKGDSDPEMSIAPATKTPIQPGFNVTPPVASEEAAINKAPEQVVRENGENNYIAKLGDIEAQQKEIYETSIDNQKQTLEKEYNLAVQKQNSEAEEEIAKLKKESDKTVQEQIRRAAASGQLPTDARGNYTRSALDQIAKIETTAAETLADDEISINRILSDNLYKLDSTRRKSSLELDSKLAEFEVTQLKNQQTRSEELADTREQRAHDQMVTQQKNAINEQVAQRKRLDGITDFKEKELFKAEVKEASANAGLTPKEAFAAFKTVAGIKDPAAAKQALQILAGQLQQMGVEADIDDFAEIILSKQELRDLEKQNLRARTAASNRSGNNSSGSTATEDRINEIPTAGGGGGNWITRLFSRGSGEGTSVEDENAFLSDLENDPNLY